MLFPLAVTLSNAKGLSMEVEMLRYAQHDKAQILDLNSYLRYAKTHTKRGILDSKSMLASNSAYSSKTLIVEQERTPNMSGKMVAPELFRPPIDFPDVPYDHLLRMAAYRNPDRPAIIYHDLILTYREVVSMVNGIANGLLNLGLTKGDRLCLFTLNRPEYTITFIAAASVGMVVSPMNPAYKEREISYQLENSEAKAILIQRELLPLFQLVMNQKSFP